MEKRSEGSALESFYLEYRGEKGEPAAKEIEKRIWEDSQAYMGSWMASGDLAPKTRE